MDFACVVAISNRPILLKHPRGSRFSPVPAQNRKYDNEPLPAPKHYNSGISQRVNDAILAGMEIEPEKRTPTVLKFRENLGDVDDQYHQRSKIQIQRINAENLTILLSFAVYLETYNLLLYNW